MRKMNREFAREANADDKIKLEIGGEKAELVSGFVCGVENRTKGKTTEVGSYLGNPHDEELFFHSFHAVIKTVIKTKAAIGEDEDDIKAFLAVVFKHAIEEMFEN